MRVRLLVRFRQIPATRPLATRPIQARLLHSSRPALASEFPPNFDSPEIVAFKQKMTQHPGVLAAMNKLNEILIKKGADLTKPPTMIQMTKYAMDADFRAAASEMMQELQKAGIDPKAAMELMQKGSST